MNFPLILWDNHKFGDDPLKYTCWPLSRENRWKAVSKFLNKSKVNRKTAWTDTEIGI